MRGAQGFTLVEIIIVLIFIGIMAAVAFPNYTNSLEQSRAAAAKNNLLAIYSTEQNYNTNNGAYVFGASLAALNTALSPLKLPDDGTYVYACAAGPPPACTATRNNGGGSPDLMVTLNAPVSVGCTGPNNWCP